MWYLYKSVDCVILQLPTYKYSGPYASKEEAKKARNEFEAKGVFDLLLIKAR